jgi:hypothetical protein
VIIVRRWADVLLCILILAGAGWIGSRYRQTFYESGAPPEVAQREKTFEGDGADGWPPDPVADALCDGANDTD